MTQFINKKSIKILLRSLLVILLIYTIAIPVWPMFWANYYSPTKPPANLGIIYNKSNSGTLTSNPKSIFRSVVIGDSTALGQGTDSVKKSFGYQYLESKKELKNQNWSFENRAISGAKISEVLERQMDFEPVDLVMVSIGANDVTGNTKPTDFEKSAINLANKLKTQAKQVIWLNLPDFVTSPILLPPLNYYLSQKERELNKILENIVPKAGYQLVDVYNQAREPYAKEPDLHFGADKYHPSELGYAVWVKIIQRKLEA